MSNDFLDFFNALSKEDFEERPVEIEEFVQSKEYLGLPPLSELQYQMIRNGSQIYKYETLVNLYGEQKGSDRWKETNTEVILQLGKGSGKDYTSTIVCAYIVYLLLCLKSPASYYGKPDDDTIDIVNIAVNSDQAKNVFFANFIKRIKACPWFDGKYHDTNISIEFDKSVRVFSGHSEREAFEGLNLFVAVLDEISAFALESATGNFSSKTADATYNTYRDSVDSRFPDFGKVLLLSFPRFEGDYIQTKYDEAIAEKEVVIRSKVLKLDPDLPDGYEGNEFTVEWEEDHIIRYTYAKVWALRRPTWEVNPTRKIEDFTRSFHKNPGNALGKYACMPSNLADGFFKSKEKIEAAFSRTNGVDDAGVFHPNFKPKADTKYFMHVDLAQKHDYCAVALAHVDRWVKVQISPEEFEVLPVVVVDALRWWTPTKEKSVDFKDVVTYIKSVRRRGFDIGLVTFDRWNSHDTMLDLQRNGISTDTLSVAKKHYDDFLSTMYDDRLYGPSEDLLKKELSELRQVKDKIDHPGKGSKDLSDATCGAIYNAVLHTPQELDMVVEVYTLADLRKQNRAEEIEKEAEKRLDTNVIKPPKRNMPSDIEQFLSSMKIV